MPYEVRLDHQPAGYALDAASGKEGKLIRVALREFVSSEDGELFVSRLEGLPAIILSHLPAEANIKPSMVDHLVAVIGNDLRTTIYVNELPFVAIAVPARPITAGEELIEDDIIDIEEARFEGVEIPIEASVVILFSVGWRKALFYDLGPLQGQPRSFDLWKLIGSRFAYLSNQWLFGLAEADWDFLFDQLWFPFISLPRRISKTLASRARSRADLDILVPEIASSLKERLPALVERWAAKSIFHSHIALVRVIMILTHQANHARIE